MFLLEIILMSIFLWLLQNIIHEMSHGIYIWIKYRWRFTIYPLPSKRLGQFTWSYINYEQTKKSKPIDNYGMATSLLIPKIVNIFFIPISFFLLMIFHEIRQVKLLLTIFVIFNYIDFSSGLINIFRKKNCNDVWNYKYYSGLSVKLLRILFSIFILVANFFLSIGLYIVWR